MYGKQSVKYGSHKNVLIRTGSNQLTTIIFFNFKLILLNYTLNLSCEILLLKLK